MRIGLFIPCYIDQLYPRVGVAALRLLEHVGVGTIEFPSEQICCGQPMANSGCDDDARPVGRDPRPAGGLAGPGRAWMPTRAPCQAGRRGPPEGR